MLSEQLTIVIPTKNEQGYIGRLLHDLIQQYDITGTKVIVADCSTDATPDIVENFSDRYSDSLDITLVNGGPVSTARNNGAKLAKTDFLLFIDADVRLPNPFHLTEALIEGKKSMVHGKKALVTSPLASYAQDWKCSLAYNIYNWVHRILVRKYPFAIGAFLLVDRNSFEQYGRFDELTDNSEDFLFSQNYTVKQFTITEKKIQLDDRRFKKIGYFGTIKHLIVNFYKFIIGDIQHFRRRSSYWGG